MHACGPTSAELKPADVKGAFHPSGPKFLNVHVAVEAQ